MASASPHFNGSTWTLVLSFNSRLNWRGVCVRMCQFNEEKVNLGVGEPDSGGGVTHSTAQGEATITKTYSGNCSQFQSNFLQKTLVSGKKLLMQKYSHINSSRKTQKLAKSAKASPKLQENKPKMLTWCGFLSMVGKKTAGRETPTDRPRGGGQ